MYLSDYSVNCIETDVRIFIGYDRETNRQLTIYESYIETEGTNRKYRIFPVPCHSSEVRFIDLPPILHLLERFSGLFQKPDLKGTYKSPVSKVAKNFGVFVQTSLYAISNAVSQDVLSRFVPCKSRLNTNHPT